VSALLPSRSRESRSSINAGLAYGLNRMVGREAQPSPALGADRRVQLLRTRGGGGDHLFGFESGAALATVSCVADPRCADALVVRWVNASRGLVRTRAPPPEPAQLFPCLRRP